MASGQRTFTVTELIRQSDGSFADSSVSFEWDAQHQSSPRVGWEFGQKQRTHREDYPGSDVPTEQVLGPNFVPFTLRGVWDDRYNYSGYAAFTREQFEALVQRGNYVRIDFDGLTITGLITDASYNYRRESYIGYEFTFSPHYRNSGGDVRQQTLAPQAISNPQSYADEAAAICLQARQIQDDAPDIFTVSTTAEAVRATIDTIIDRVNTCQSILDTRVLVTTPGSQAVNSIARLVQGFASIKQGALDTLALLGTTNSTSGLDYETAILTLEYEIWQRELAYTMRALIVAADKAFTELGRLVVPRTIAYYRPHAKESLYGIANQFYNAPERWRDIYDANDLTSIVLTGTELLVIPDVS